MPSPRERSRSASPLAETQRAFAAALEGSADGTSALLAHLAGEPERNRRRVAAYRRNVVGNWINALGLTYPVVAGVLGDAAFRRLAESYVANHASQSGDLNEYGADFPAHIDARVAKTDCPWLADLARLEWALQAAYYAADSEPIDFARLAAVPPEQHGRLRFRLAPAFRTLVSDWPLAALWQRLQDGQAADVGARPGRQTTWIVRPGGRVWAETASAGEAAFAAALAAGADLATAIGAAMTDAPAFDVGAAIARMAGLGLLAGIDLPGESA